MSESTYPARLDGQLEPGLSRWLWLFKWLLVIPHLVVLAFLGVAFFFMTFVAFFAILVTGRYPKSLFEFNLGVMRWGWRVAYYSYGALGTDRYPPFSLDDVDYPARFDVDYPEDLSRGLVLIKWWLLALPHWVIVGLLASGFVWTTAEAAGSAEPIMWMGGGLIGLLVTVAGVILLFSGSYPQGLYDFVMGLNRWVFRVWAYVGLMTDEYPPFRLDSGGIDPGTDTRPPASRA